MRIPLAAFAASLVLVATLAPAAQAQRSRSRTAREVRSDRDENWLDRCRRDDWGDRDRERFCEERTMGWRARDGVALTVDASPNGGVSVRGWDRDSVHVVARVQAYGESARDAEDVAKQVRISNDNGTLRSDGPSSRRNSNWSVSFVIYAPRHADLTLETVNGPVEVQEVVGRLSLRAQNGPLSLDRVGGDVRAHAQNGPLTVTLTGSRWEGAGLDAETMNGPLVLEVPEGYNAELETGTINGPMDIGFPVMVQGSIGMGRHRHLTTTLGSGGPRIRVVTTNGPAVLRRS